MKARCHPSRRVHSRWLNLHAIFVCWVSKLEVSQAQLHEIWRSRLVILTDRVIRHALHNAEVVVASTLTHSWPMTSTSSFVQGIGDLSRVEQNSSESFSGAYAIGNIGETSSAQLNVGSNQQNRTLKLDGRHHIPWKQLGRPLSWCSADNADPRPCPPLTPAFNLYHQWTITIKV